MALIRLKPWPQLEKWHQIILSRHQKKGPKNVGFEPGTKKVPTPFDAGFEPGPDKKIEQPITLRVTRRVTVSTE